MSSGIFFGINIGVTALRAQQTALSVTGHNIANANTPGYSRQVANMQTNFALPVPSNNRWVGAGQIGTGVSVSEVKRVRDQFIDWQIRQESGVLEEWRARHDTLTQIETVFMEPMDTGLSELLNNFWNSWQDLSKSPDSSPVRTTVKETAIALAEAFRHSYERLENIEEGLKENMEILKNEANSLLSQIAALNEQIKFITTGGHNPNDLLDQRDLLLDRLAELMDIEVNHVFANVAGKVVPTGEVNVAVKIAGYPFLVNIIDPKYEKGAVQLVRDGLDIKAEGLQVDYKGSDISVLDFSGSNNLEFNINGTSIVLNKNYSDPSIEDPVAVIASDIQDQLTADGNSTVTVSHVGNSLIISNAPSEELTISGVSGDLSIIGLSQISLGDTLNFSTGEMYGLQKTGADSKTDASAVSYYKNKLDVMAEGLTRILNEIHKEGLTLKQDGAGNYIKGEDFFIFKDEDGNTTVSAKYIYLNPDIESDVGHIAAGKLRDDQINPDDFYPGNNENALLIAGLRNLRLTIVDDKLEKTDGTGDLKFDTYYQNFVSELGVATTEADRMVENQTTLVNQLTNRRESVAGVSIDEEMANMIKFQHAFQAASKYISVLDELAATIVNGLKA
jgi:flagellar hook-associated protein 1 FlgK